MLNSLPPSVPKDAKILILGSMPGAESLRRQQYYAFPQNAFWKIMGTLLDFSPALTYPERMEILKRKKVGLWDVLASCEREGSLDAHIMTEVPNDIPGLLEQTPSIRSIFCNGGTAYRFLNRYFPALRKTHHVIKLPSTSPAAAGIPYEKKLEAFRQIKAALETTVP